MSYEKLLFFDTKPVLAKCAAHCVTRNPLAGGGQ